MKERPIANNKKEIDLLRNDTKSLLCSLKEHQNKVLNSFYKLKEKDLHKNEALTYPIDSILNPNFAEITETYQSEPLTTHDFKKTLRKNNSIKTVSFSDYLRTCNSSGKGLVISPRRISKSVSPYSSARKTPSKSILKKQLVQDELSDNDHANDRKYSATTLKNNKSNTSSTSSISMSTNSLLSLNIYGEYYNENDEFDENLKDIFRYRDTNNLQNDSSFIDFIAKKRQAYLNHTYNSSSNLNLDKIDQCDHNLNILDVSTGSTKLSDTKKIDVSHWNRSHSAESDRKSRSRSRSLSRTTNLCKKVNINDRKRSKSPNNNNKINTSTEIIKNRKKSPIKTKSYKKIAKQMKKNRPLLGYDWALDALHTKLNTTPTKYEKPEEFWEDLNSFRNQHRDDCVSSKQINFDGSTSTFFDDSRADLGIGYEKKNETDGEDDGRNHKCIHSYTLNDRLFPVPIYKAKNGQSMCPVCKSTKKEATNYSPQFCKISIPKSKVMEPYKIEPNRRSQINSEDTLSLAEHCIAGYQNAPNKGSNMYCLPKSKNVDLKSATGVKNQLEKLTIDDIKRIASNKDPATSGVYNKGNAMRYELEDQHLKRLREFTPKIKNN